MQPAGTLAAVRKGHDMLNQASAAGLLVASFLLCQVILLAAELNDVLAQRRLTRQSILEEPKEEHDV